MANSIEQTTENLNPQLEEFRQLGKEEGMGKEEIKKAQLQHIEAALEEIDHTTNTLAQIGRERTRGGHIDKNIKKEHGSLFDKIKYLFTFDKDKLKNQADNIAERYARKELDALMARSQEVIALALALENKKKADKQNLDNTRSLLGPESEEMKTFEETAAQEQKTQQDEIDQKRADLNSDTENHPILEKQTELAQFALQYKEYHQMVTTEIKQLEAKERKYQTTIDKMNVDDPSGLAMQQHLNEQLVKLQEELESIREIEGELKNRRELVATEKSEVDKLANEFKKLGKTPAEIAAERKQEMEERTKKAAAEKKPEVVTEATTAKKEEVPAQKPDLTTKNEKGDDGSNEKESTEEESIIDLAKKYNIPNPNNLDTQTKEALRGVAKEFKELNKTIQELEKVQDGSYAKEQKNKRVQELTEIAKKIKGKKELKEEITNDTIAALNQELGGDDTDEAEKRKTNKEKTGVKKDNEKKPNEKTSEKKANETETTVKTEIKKEEVKKPEQKEGELKLTVEEWAKRLHPELFHAKLVKEINKDFIKKFNKFCTSFLELSEEIDKTKITRYLKGYLEVDFQDTVKVQKIEQIVRESIRQINYEKNQEKSKQ